MRRNLVTVVSLLAVVALCACSTTSDTEGTESEVSSIKSALEMENGGLDMEDEQPGFGLPSLDEGDIQLDIPLPELEPEGAAGAMGQVPPAGDPGTGGQVPGQTPPQAPEGQPGQPPEGQPNLPLPPAPCPRGLLMGGWKELKAGFGVFEGKWGSDNGKVVGHLKGVYGKNLKGEGVLFAKYIGLQGKFMGIVKGHHEKGFFKGRWFDKGGLQGDLAGIYGEGHFLGLWRAYCPLCKVQCVPGFVAVPEAQCMCVPDKQPLPCKVGQCPQGMTCDVCPPACPPGVQCPAACGAPVCVPLPPPPKPGQDPNAPAGPGESNAGEAPIE